MVGGGRSLLPESVGQTDPVRATTPIFNRYSLVAPRPHEKSSISLTLIVSSLRAF